MKNHIQNIAILPFVYHSLATGLMHQRKFIQKTIVSDIEAIKKDSDGSLSESDFKKISDYYAYAVPAILGEGFSILRGKPMTIKERLAMTYIGALSGLFDDFFDEKNTSEVHIQELISSPNVHRVNNSHELLFVRFYSKVLNNTEERSLLLYYANKVYDAQLLSKKQKSPDIARDEIISITLQKGGVSFLLYRSVLNEPADALEEQMIYKLGGLFQLENDIFDVYKDFKSGIQTLATTETKIEKLRKEYTLLMKETFQMVHQTQYPKKNQTKFLRFISLAILRGFVCLDQLEKNEKSTENTFLIGMYKRNDLICDMERIKSIISLLRYYSKLNVRFQ